MTQQDDERLTKEHDLLERSLQLRSGLTGDVDRHLYHGFVQRLLMLQAGRMHLLEKADGRDLTPRGIYMATELSLHANAYYLNLRGALDNLAWMLQYRWMLIPATTESAGRRTAVYLFGADFLDALQGQHQSLADDLRTHSPWASDLSTRRDPAAHRIPLQVPRTVFSEEDAQQMREIEAEAKTLFDAGQFKEGMAVHRRIEHLGTFEARLLQATAAGPVSSDLHAQVGSDHDSLLTVSDLVLSHF